MKNLERLGIKIVGSILFMFFPFTCKMCEKPFEPNPNLRLLLKDEKYNLGNAVFTKSGWIYYTKKRGIFAGDCFGDVWRIKEDRSENQLVLNGEFSSIDVSKSETLLIAVESDNKIIRLYRLQSFIEDTLPVEKVSFAKFGESDTIIYYTSIERNEIGKIYKLNLLTYQNVPLIDSVNIIRRFDVFKDSLICYYAYFQNSYYIYDMKLNSFEKIEYGGKFNPEDANLLLFEKIVGEDVEDLVIFIRNTKSLNYLKAYPYKRCHISSPVWMNGNKIIFSVSPLKKGDPSYWYPYELWILEKF